MGIAVEWRVVVRLLVALSVVLIPLLMR